MKLPARILFLNSLTVALSLVRGSTTLRGGVSTKAINNDNDNGNDHHPRQLQAPPCVNDAPLDHIDTGCDSSHPICIQASGHEASADAPGIGCVMCVNTQASDFYADLGCDDGAMQCQAPTGLGGQTCGNVEGLQTCMNTQSWGGTDIGCTAETPICMDTNTQHEASAMAPGQECALCVKVYQEADYSHGRADHGCAGATPRCMEAEPGRDPVLNRAGAQCCAADGDCGPRRPSQCPCNLPATTWATLLHSPHHPMAMDYCVHSHDTDNLQYSLLYWSGNNGLAAQMGVPGEPPKCFTPDYSLEITGSEALACLDEIERLAEAHYGGFDLCGDIIQTV